MATIYNFDFNLPKEDEEPDRPLTALPGSKLASPDAPLDFNFRLPTDEDDLRTSVDLGSQSNPDDAAKAHNLAGQTGLPTDLVERNLSEVESDQQKNDTVKKLREWPIAAEFMSDLDNAKVAYDDVDALTGLESIWDGAVGNVVRGMGENVFSMGDKGTSFLDIISKAAGTPFDALNRALGTEPVDPDVGLGTAILDLVDGIETVLGMRDADATPTRDLKPQRFGYKEGITWEEFLDSPARNFIPYTLEKGLVSLPEMIETIFALPVAIVTRSTGIAEDRSKSDKRKEPTIRDLMVAMPAGAASAFLDRLSGRNILGLDDTLKRTGVRGVLGATGRGATTEAVTEGTQEAIESLAATVGTERGYNAQETLTRMAQGAVVGLGFGGQVRAGTASVESVVKSNRTKRNKQIFEAMGDSAEASKLRERLPKRYREFVERVLEKGEVQDVYVDADALTTLMQTNPIEIEGLDLPALIDEAGQTGQAVPIPLADYQTYIAGTDVGQALMNDLKFANDEMTFNESVRAEAEVRNIIEGDYAALVEAGELDDATEAAFEGFKTQWRAELIEAGQDPSVAEEQSELLRKTGHVFAVKYGMSPEEVFGQLSIKGPVPEGAAQATVDGLDLIIDRVRAGTTMSDKQLFGASLQDFARNLGIIDDRGDLAGADIDADLKPFQRRMLREGGRALDGVLEAAVEAGYFPETGGERQDLSLSDFIDVLTGPDRFIEGQIDPAEATRQEVADDLSEFLTRIGVDLDAFTNEEVRQVLYDAMEEEGGVEFTQSPGTDGLTVVEFENFKTGQEVTFDFAHNTESATALFGIPDQDSPFGRGFEPSGKYVVEVTDASKVDTTGSMTGGTLTFSNPLVLDVQNWKQELSEKYGATGKALSAAILAHGYDGVVTVQIDDRPGRSHTSEILDLTTFDESLALYQSARLQDISAGPDGRTMLFENELAKWQTVIEEMRGSGQAMRGKDIRLGRTPYVYQALGLRSKTLEIAASKIRLQWRDKDVPNDVWDRLPELINDPLYVLNDDETNTVMAVLDAVNADGAPIVAIIKGGGENKSGGQQNIVKSVYDIEGGLFTLQKMADERGVLYDGSKKPSRSTNTVTLAVTSGNRSSSPVRAERNILNRDDVVKKMGRVFYQPDGSGVRGSIQFFNDRTIINLGEAADLSTFLHEAGHLFVNTLARIAETNEKAAADLGVMMNFVGAETIEGFNQVEAQEKLARAFEAYLREGKAPSVALQGAFSRFQSWLTAVYKTLLQLDIELTDEIRGVFDRMIATEEEIAEAEQVNNFLPMKGIEDLMPDAGEAYVAAGERARDKAVETLKKKKIAEDVREETERWKAEYKRVFKDIMSGIDSQPIYQAMDAVKGGSFLDRDAVLDLIGAEGAKRLPKGLTRVSGGSHPDHIAQQFGFTSGDEMLMSMLNAAKNKRDRADLGKELAEEQMRERHGSLDTNKMQAAEAAGDAVMNDERGLFLAMELNALATRSGTQPTSAAVARAAAQQMLAGKTVAEATQSGRYRMAAAKAGRDATRALLAEDFAAATEAKMRQILNHYLARESADIANRIDAMTDRMRKWQVSKMNPKIIHPDFIKQAKELLVDVSFANRTGHKKMDRLTAETFDRWAKDMEEEYGARFHIAPELETALSKQNYRDMTVPELTGLHDVVKSVITQGRRYSDAERAQFNSMVEKIAAGIDGNAKKPVKNKREKSGFDRKKAALLQFVADHRRIDSLSDELDGYQGFPADGSVGVFRSVYLRIKNADDRYIDRAMKAGKEVTEILNAYTAREKIGFFRKKFIPALGDSLSLNARLAFALNMGNAGNVEAMQNEYSDVQISAVLSTLTDKDWDVVEAIWANIDQYGDELLALEERTTGVKPERVAAVPFTTPSGREVTGGYYPLIADHNQSEAGRKDMEDRTSLTGFMGKGHAKATTKSGATIERKGFGQNRYVLLDLSAVYQHIDGVIKDIELREAVVEVHRIVNHPKFEAAVKEAKGKEFHLVYNKWLENVVGGSREPQTTLEKFYSYARTGASIAEMGFSVRTMMMQPFGITQSIVMIGEMNVARGTAEFIGGRGAAIRKVMGMSPFMANRAATFNRDVRDAQHLVGVQGLHASVVTASFSGIAMLDMAVSIPTWLGAHGKAINEGMSEQDAIDYADSVVSRSQGTGLPRDMADISSGMGFKRVFTMFYSFFSSYHNLQTDQWKQTSFKSPTQALRWAKNQVWITIIPSLLVDFVFNGGPPDEDDWMKWIGVSLAKFSFGGVVGVRDVVNASATGFGYQMSPAGGLPKHLANTVQQIKQGENDVALWRTLVMAVGYGGHVPGARTVNRAIGVIDDEGADDMDEFDWWWRVFVQGKKKN